MICETKIVACSPTSQALINVYTSQYRLGRNGKRGGILTYAQVDISSKFITANFPNVEGFFLEINLREKKWVTSSSYNPQNQTFFSHMESMGKAVNSPSSKYENFLIIGNFNVQAGDTCVKDFCDIYSFKRLIKKSASYKNPNNPKCIDFMLMNLMSMYFFDSNVFYNIYKLSLISTGQYINQGRKFLKFSEF